MEQILRTVNRAVSSNAVINTLLVGAFAALAARSVAQERTIEVLEAEKELVLKINKGIKSTIWDWKQKLYAEAEANPQGALVPLSTLKSIYGEVITSTNVNSGGDDKQDGQSPAPKIMIY